VNRPAQGVAVRRLLGQVVLRALVDRVQRALRLLAAGDDHHRLIRDAEEHRVERWHALGHLLRLSQPEHHAVDHAVVQGALEAVKIRAHADVDLWSQRAAQSLL
jgi:hypothetical protein